MLVVFNWTDGLRSHAIKLANLGLPTDGKFQAADVLDHDAEVAANGGTVQLHNMPRHSVRAIKLIDTSIPATAPEITAQVSAEGHVSEELAFSAGGPALDYHWDFGDGTTADGPRATHTYTRDADFKVQLTAVGLDGTAAHENFTVKVTGTLVPAPDVLGNRRYTGR
jgi:hypothetical protein